MRPIALRRLKALILTTVLLVGGSGASAFDLAVFHLGGAPAAAATHRIAGTEAPRPHGDSCLLLDWSARGPYTASLTPAPLPAIEVETDLTRPAPVATPRPADLFATPRPRAPPVPLA
ncbi:MAG: hypothetical protein H0X69_05545 [Gemmatimonadales bacterium]|nr:hypothetical protein [Gemmatimonadales bacterium]